MAENNHFFHFIHAFCKFKILFREYEPLTSTFLKKISFSGATLVINFGHLITSVLEFKERVLCLFSEYFSIFQSCSGRTNGTNEWKKNWKTFGNFLEKSTSP